MARTISRCWGVSVGAAHTREPRLSAALLALGKIIFWRIKEGLWEEYLPPVHGRRHPVDRQGRPVDIGILPVNGQPEHVDMDIDPVNKEVCPVNMESCGIQAEWECQQAISICLHVRSDVDTGILPVSMILCLSTSDTIL